MKKNTELPPETYKAIFDFSPEAIVLLDGKGTVKAANKRLTDWLGYLPDKIIGKNLLKLDLLTKESKKIAFSNLTKRLKGEKIPPYTLEFISKEGKPFFGRIHAMALKNQDGKATGDVIFITNVTELAHKEESLRISKDILFAVNKSAEVILSKEGWDSGIDEVLAVFGESARVSRVYIFKNDPPTEKGGVLTSQLYEWTADDIDPQIDNDSLQKMPFKEVGFGRWIDNMQKGEAIYGAVSAFPEKERAVLELQNILAIVTVPIFVDDKWWGFIGFDDCKQAREWGTEEVTALNAAAKMLGLAISSQYAREQLKEETEELEKINKLMVGRELRMVELKDKVAKLKTPSDSVTSIT